MVEEGLPNIPVPLVMLVIITLFVDSENYSTLLNRRSHIGIFVFINNYLIMSFINRQMRMI